VGLLLKLVDCMSISAHRKDKAMDNILTDSEILIIRKVRDIDHMILCDGFQYGIITYRNRDQLVRRPRSMVTWRFVMNLEATIKEDQEREESYED
jgi:hypothetical protein